MEPTKVERIESWDARPFNDGYAGLQRLADQEFSGAVTVGGTWLFMVNGRIVGVTDGTIESFETGTGTAYDAPHVGVPLLFAMQLEGGEVQGKYFTDDTALETVKQTLSEGSFTGYVKLSENVLSGEYFLVFHGGKSMSLAFIGNAGRLLTDEEAYRQACEEVGIYEVRSVTLEEQTIPESVESEGVEGPMPENDPEPSPISLDEEVVGGADGDDFEEEVPSAHSPSGDREDDLAPTEPLASSGEPAETGDDPTEKKQTTDPIVEAEDPAAEPESRQASTEEPAEGTDTGGRPSTDHADTSSAGSAETDPFAEEQEWRETRTIPALDPEESGPSSAPTQAASAVSTSERPDRDTGQAEPPKQTAEAETSPDERHENVAELVRTVEKQASTIDELEERLERVQESRDALRTDDEGLSAEVEGSTEAEEAAAGHAVSPGEALAGTDLFVRYDSKGQATLQSAHAGEADREAVNANLRLERHTRFESEHTVVDGRSYDSFIEDRIEYRFVEWLIEDFLFEIQETGNEGRLSDLYDTLPSVDRAAFDSSITVTDEESDEHEERFDLVLRDRMGAPLLVANVNDDREPATASMMEHLLEATEAVAAGHDSLRGTFLVTASFFDPGAVETAEEATRGGLFNRDPRASFVKLSRKRGFHACLVEARAGQFHVAVPDL